MEVRLWSEADTCQRLRVLILQIIFIALDIWEEGNNSKMMPLMRKKIKWVEYYPCCDPQHCACGNRLPAHPLWILTCHILWHVKPGIRFTHLVLFLIKSLLYLLLFPSLIHKEIKDRQLNSLKLKISPFDRRVHWLLLIPYESRDKLYSSGSFPNQKPPISVIVPLTKAMVNWSLAWRIDRCN